jgi:sterol desaturase/sphingolipid hydroxylase (fatty acid hydroxylase superfamily)
MRVAVLFAAGVVVWTLLEYGLHRFAMHGRALGTLVRKEHLAHHATPNYFTSLARKLALAVPVLGGLGALGALVFGPSGLALALGTTAGWVFYEQLHRATHVRGPRNAYGEWARRHHLHHHFQNAEANHGVTSPIWDWVFGTLERPATIAVPRRHVHCFAWLLDDEGIAPRYAAHYRLVGSPATASSGRRGEK